MELIKLITLRRTFNSYYSNINEKNALISVLEPQYLGNIYIQKVRSRYIFNTYLFYLTLMTFIHYLTLVFKYALCASNYRIKISTLYLSILKIAPARQLT